MKIFELVPVDGRKSFGGKCRVYEQLNGDAVLMSYNTEVAKITSGGEFVRLWWGHSQTTSRHIKAFKAFYGVDGKGADGLND